MGFCIIKQEADAYYITDFVISCRVAQKMVEHSFVYWLKEKMEATQKTKLLVDYIKTARNAPILAVFEDLEFEKQDLGNDHFILSKEIDKMKEEEKIITVYESK